VVTGSVDQEQTACDAFAAAGELGSLRLVVNCAGQGVFAPVGEATAEDIQRVMAGNLNGLILFSEYAVRALEEMGGDIVNVMSTSAKKLRPAEAIYCAAKWGAKAYTRTLRDALKARKAPIRVFEVYPCGMDTPFWSAAVRPVADGTGFSDPGDIAEVVLTAVLATGSAYAHELTFERA
jgi:NAD(P)-dependent dehydrogenase (short-subunit alcohol dehydrogenase family)